MQLNVLVDKYDGAAHITSEVGVVYSLYKASDNVKESQPITIIAVTLLAYRSEAEHNASSKNYNYSYFSGI